METELQQIRGCRKKAVQFPLGVTLFVNKVILTAIGMKKIIGPRLALPISSHSSWGTLGRREVKVVRSVRSRRSDSHS